MAKSMTLDSSALSALLEAVNTDGLSEEKQQAITKLKIEVADVQKSEEIENSISEYNDILLENAKGVSAQLPVNIPDCIDIIKLAYDFDVDKQTFVPVQRIDTIRAIPGVLTEVFLHFRVFLLDGATKEQEAHVIDCLNQAGKQAHDVDDYNAMIESFLDWREIEPTIQAHLSDETCASLIGSIELSDDLIEHITKGSIVLAYNSPAIINGANPENLDKATEGSWSITTAGFNKATKYTKKSSGGESKKASGSDWIPDSMEAKNTREYLLEVFGDDEKLTKAIERHSKDDIPDWTKLNASQHILRCEKKVPEAQRYYTNFKSAN